jgi:transmembrane sensor
VAEFNRHNRQQISIADPEIARAPIGGTFRVDNVEGFVGLLEITLGLEAERRSDGTVRLKRGR